MVTSTTTVIPTLPEYAQQPTVDMAATLQQLLGQQLDVPAQQVAGFSPTQQAAMQQAFGGIGAYQPFLDAAQQAQAAALGTTGAGVQALGQMNFDPNRAQAFMDPYQQNVTNEALKEIDRQAAMAQNQLAGKAVQAGAFGGSRFGLQQSETARNAQDLKSRRIFEDLSRNYQQAQATAQAANTQRLQQGQMFGNLGKATSGIGGAMAGIGGMTQQMGQSDVNQLMGIGGLQQQLAQTGLNVDYQNQMNLQNAPYQQLSTGAGILQQLLPNMVGTQTVAPLPQTNPYAQAAGVIAGAGGLAGLIGN
tara:strand:- start:1921 stop:2835 length:915 start_codon:yes stop_codon:yes gene_type:complete